MQTIIKVYAVTVYVKYKYYYIHIYNIFIYLCDSTRAMYNYLAIYSISQSIQYQRAFVCTFAASISRLHFRMSYVYRPQQLGGRVLTATRAACLALSLNVLSSLTFAF